MLCLTIVNKMLCHCHTWLALQYMYGLNSTLAGNPLSVSYFMVCAYIREYNPQALISFCTSLYVLFVH